MSAEESLRRPPSLSPSRIGDAARDARWWLGLYLTALALVAFWPVPVDSGAGELLLAVTRAVPWFTYRVIEFTANVVLFVPLGALLSLVLPAHRRWVVPIAFGVTVLIESGQAILLSARTPAVSDVVANVLGATIGVAAVWAIERRSRRDVGEPPGAASTL
ncbi:VanZ family protein [Microbacterium hominis]|uniref:VanZ family protein n=1 Tax=Microbacterium hominis TaxID=162426 RepID=A0A7D4UC73_9MICO|nr:VanZ family protein [Microbacterium hominis]QKJ20303.1 VanZ family protein [Microbacterium hominis]